MVGESKPIEKVLLECGPLETLEALDAWQRAPGVQLGRARVRFQPRAMQPDGPRVIHCHDLSGNYKLDRFLNGSRGAEWYAFAHWQYIDTFVYFGHALCVVPPPGWIDAAHRHGVRALGALLLEGDDATPVLKALLQRPDHYVMQLTALLAHIGFDGWLLNIETPLPTPADALALQDFVAKLREATRRAAGVEAGQVIWYDAVDCNGEVNYQNALTEKNDMFFQVADGIYTNYFWKEEALKRSAAAAGGRLRDVYMGVDVYGRGAFGGGGMTCDRAAEVIRAAGMSMALFAPAWTWEKHPRDQFLSKEAQFWTAVGRIIEPRPLPRADAFVSNFDTGSGRGLWIEGRESRPEPFYDMAMQQHQPTFLDRDQGGGAKVTRYSDAAFNGGSCLAVQVPNLPTGGTYVKLFALDLKIGGTGRAHVSLVFAKLDDAADAYDVKLALKHEDPTGALAEALAPDVAGVRVAGDDDGDDDEYVEEVVTVPTPSRAAANGGARGSRVGDFLMRWCGAPPPPEEEDGKQKTTTTTVRRKKTKRSHGAASLTREPSAALKSEEFVMPEGDDGPRWVRRTYEFGASY